MGNNKKAHWWVSPSGHYFYAVKFNHNWRFVGNGTSIIKEVSKINKLKSYVSGVFGFDYVGYM